MHHADIYFIHFYTVILIITSSYNYINLII